MAQQRLRLALLAGCLATVSACGSPGAFVWVDKAPDSIFAPAPEGLIRTGDVVAVRVFGQDSLSTRATVGTPGTVAVPLVGEVQVSGKAPEAVAKDIAERLEPFINTPHVVVSVEETSTVVAVIGEVSNAGVVVLNHDLTVLAALAEADGLTEFADRSMVFVLRREPNGLYRIRFKYEDIVRGVGKAAAFRLRTGDQLIVE